jgi:nucleoside 2-deoxyribosyltransferase
MATRVYLAGPDVFLPDPRTRGARMKAICAAHGLVGVFPLDPGPVPAGPLMPEWQRIALANEAHIRGCDALIANLTPFRGPSADPGTVFELGFMRALGRPVFGWSASALSLKERSPPDFMQTEDFGQPENLMVAGAIAASGGVFLAETLAEPWADLRLFERCVACAAGVLSPARADPKPQRSRTPPAGRQTGTGG